jgi:hypothetical protein
MPMPRVLSMRRGPTWVPPMRRVPPVPWVPPVLRGPPMLRSPGTRPQLTSVRTRGARAPLTSARAHLRAPALRFDSGRAKLRRVLRRTAGRSSERQRVPSLPRSMMSARPARPTVRAPRWLSNQARSWRSDCARSLAHRVCSATGSLCAPTRPRARALSLWRARRQRAYRVQRSSPVATMSRDRSCAPARLME